MKKKSWNSKRNILLMIQHITLIALIICGLALVTEYVYRGYSISYMLDEKNTSEEFEDGIVFQDLFSYSISSAIRFGVIREQFETNGLFDGKKEMDIQNYAYHRSNNSSQVKSTAYYLDDLIKWGQIGFSYTTITQENYYQKLEQAKNKFSPKEQMRKAVTPEVEQKVDPNLNILEYTTESLFDNVEEEGTWYAEEYNPVFTIIDDEKFYPIDGKPLLLHTTSPYEYQDYTRYLVDSIDTAYRNYIEYKELRNKFSDSNFKYYISYELDGEHVIYTNLIKEDELKSGATETEITHAFGQLGKYIYCDYDNLISSTNTYIKEVMIWDEVRNYSYSYPGNVKLWFGVDTNYAKDDEYYIYHSNYSDNFLTFRNLFVASIFFALFYVFLLVILTAKEQKEETSNPRLIDKLYTEFAFLLAVIICTSIIYFTGYICYDIIYLNYHSFFSLPSILIIGTGTFLLDLFFMHFYLSLVRRIKNHIIWKHSFSNKVIEVLLQVYNNPKVAVRTWIPYLLFLFVNFLLLAMSVNGRPFPIFIAIILDVLLGIFLYRENDARLRVLKGIEKIKDGNLTYQIDANKMHGDNLILANSVNSIGEGIRNAVENSMKDERLKTDLITNVSHDIKTPLTSIINYVDLIKRENIENENIMEYVKILDSKSQRLKQLTEDLVEASKISSGNIELIFEKIDFTQLIYQTLGEFDERFKNKGLDVIINVPNEPVYIQADSRRIWRVIDNLCSNIVKYAMENTRVYMDMQINGKAVLTIKNISSQPLNINANELTERFIRGDISRNTEGSGLGLSIAKSLTQLQNGKFEIYLDGDLFKVILEFAIQSEKSFELSSKESF
ncbi:MAG TPA: histidine kinase dimerization/phospho-acceptor domain-containing protein [Lachnospiraceae bacterium]|nr:histidine kinase dimerization/phospho-acceptor domain-containing protein [Lachnospiraceae bacterium]